MIITPDERKLAVDMTFAALREYLKSIATNHDVREVSFQIGTAAGRAILVHYRADRDSFTFSVGKASE